MSGLVLSAVIVYPIKGAKGFHPRSWSLDALGLRLDRRWMLVDADGQCISQRTHPRLALITPTFDGETLALSAPGIDPEVLPIESPPASERVSVRMDEEEVWVSEVGGNLAKWFGSFLDVDCRLVYIRKTAIGGWTGAPRQAIRSVSRTHSRFTSFLKRR